MIKHKNKGITLISLVITIIILLIISGVTIIAITGNNGIIKKAEVSKISSELSNYKEELEQWKLSKTMEDDNFSEDTLFAGKNNLAYNSSKKDGNIKNIIPDLSDTYIDELEIIKGNLIINTIDNIKIEASKISGISSNPYIIKDGELMSAGENLDLMSGDGTIIIPENVTKIGEGAFANVQGLKKIIIPGNVKEIGSNAFASNKTLETVILQEGVEIIGTSAFNGCDNLKSIEMPESIIEIRSSAFYNCKKLEKIEIPSKVEYINSLTFIFNYSLKEVKFRGTNVKGYGWQAFGCCESLEEFNITKNVSQIGERVFASDKKLERINIDSENNNFVYESGMLMEKDKSKIYFVSSQYLDSITTFSIPEGITDFNVSITGNNPTIKTLNIPSTLKSIGTVGLPSSIETVNIDSKNENFKTLENCIYTKNDEELIYCYSKEKNIILKNNFKIAKTDAFSGAANNVESITFPESTTTIQVRTFVYCAKLKVLNLGKNVSDINPDFRANTNMDITLNIDEENPYYVVKDKVLYNKNEDKLLAVLYKINGTYTVPDNIKIIGSNAFKDQENMTNIVLNQNLEKLENRIFASCNKLNNIEIPGNVNYIGENCFADCSAISNIKINKKENSISGTPWGATKGLKVINWSEK